MKHPKIAGRGTGAAHHSWWMFGARGPCLAPEPEGGGSPSGSGGGDDPPDPGDDPPPGDKPDGKAAGEKLFTQADMDRAVKERLDRERRSSQRQKTSSDKKPESKSSKAETDPRLIYEFQDELESVLDETGLKPSPGLKRRMRDAYVSDRPDDPTSWIKSWLDDAGLKKPAPPPDNNKQAKADDVADPKKGSAPPISDKGPPAPGGARDVDALLLERPLELSDGDIERLQLKHGPDKANTLIREHVNASLRRMKLIADPRRKAD